ncbi:MAG TPA: hypothetical protein VHV55_07725 [Pirellulales bacterium]|jgi:hypothetical protein|nr:hypothetical protein [Pirellulales bacterium]
MNHSPEISRRAALAYTTASLAAGCFGRPTPLAAADNLPAKPPARLPRVAAINTIYRFRSHAYHIAGRFIHGYSREGFHHQPPFKLVRMFNDQYPSDDLSREVCRRHDVQLCTSVAEALGGKQLDVDAVLLIAEHGDYPLNEFRQILYPRYKLFEQIVEVFRTSGRSVPVFSDKHLSYDHRLAARMVATSRELKFGLMAGSSIPVTWRRPEFEPPLGTPFREGLVTFGSDHPTPEVYLFHALEGLQCMLERRVGGETGVRSVTGLTGDAVWKAGDDGRWSWDLFRAALATSPSLNIGSVRENVERPVALLIEYRDGTRGTVINLSGHTTDLCFAGNVAGRQQPLATCFYLPAPPGAKYFNALVSNIERFFTSGRPPYPIERTLLTSTVLDLGMHSLHDNHPQQAPALEIRYTPPADSGFFRGSYTDAL